MVLACNIKPGKANLNITVSKNASLVKSVASYCAIAKIQNKMEGKDDEISTYN